MCASLALRHGLAFGEATGAPLFLHGTAEVLTCLYNGFEVAGEATPSRPVGVDRGRMLNPRPGLEATAPVPMTPGDRSGCLVQEDPRIGSIFMYTVSTLWKELYEFEVF